MHSELPLWQNAHVPVPDTDVGGDNWVEHIRTINFSILAVCFALMAAMLMTEDNETQIALNQLRQIQDLSSAWRDDWYESQAAKRLRELSLPPLTDRYVVVVGTARKPVALGRRWVLGFDGAFYEADNSSIRAFRADLRRDLRRNLSTRPETLSQFKELWDDLGTHDILVIAASDVASRALVWLPGLGTNDEVYPPEMVESGSVRPSIGDPKEEDTGMGLSFFSQGFSKWAMSDRLAKEVFGTHLSTKDCGFWGFLDDSRVVIIPVVPHRFTMRGQPALADAHHTSLHYGSFDVAFPELAKITAGYQELTFKTMNTVLSNEARRSPDRVELFGAKIPAVDLATWGIPALVILQLYFVWHLNAFRAQFREAMSTAVPWIGMYRSALPRAATIVSLVILPPAVIFLLASRSTSSNSWLATYLREMCAISVIVSMFTIVALIQLWRDQSHSAAAC